MDAFCDTNVLIGYVFILDYLNRYSAIVFNEYSTVFCSDNVKNEYDKVFKDKYKKLSNQIFYLQNYLGKSGVEFYDLKLIKKEFDDLNKDFIGFLDSFWNNYLEFNGYITLAEISNSLDICRRDLKENTFFRDSKLKDMMTLINNNNDNYEEIDKKVKSLKIHSSDRKIVLDAHDFNLKNNNPLDFITFDERLFNGIKRVQNFSFNSIKSKDDFLN